MLELLCQLRSNYDQRSNELFVVLHNLCLRIEMTDKYDELLARLDALQAVADAEIPGTEDALFASVMDVFQEACLMVGEEMKEIFPQ